MPLDRSLGKLLLVITLGLFLQVNIVKWKCNIILSRSFANSLIRAYTHFHLKQNTTLCFDDDNEGARKATLPHYTFLYISLPSMHDFDVKLPHFTFYGGRKDRRQRSFFSLSEIGYGSQEFNDRRVRPCLTKRGSCYNQAEV